MIDSLGTIIESIDLKQRDLFYDLLTRIRNNDKFELLLSDNVNAIKKYQYNDYYNDNFDNNRALFIGNGISEQYVIKTGRIPRKYRENPYDNFGYIIDNSNVEYIKLLEYDDE